MTTRTYLDDSLNLLRDMIRIPSVSRQEKAVADHLESALRAWFPHAAHARHGHSLVVTLSLGNVGTSSPTLLLCSHIDTVDVAHGWTRNPFGAEEAGDAIYGLGSNDAGASVVSMIAAARTFINTATAHHGTLVLSFVAEEEAGDQGFYTIEKSLPRYDNAVFGEPTDMGVASAMRGAMRAVMRSHGTACHSSRPWEGDNACDHFVTDLLKLRSLDLKDNSPWSCTTIEPTILRGGQSPNQIPDLIETTLDIRTTPEKDNDWVISQFAALNLDIDITFNRRRPMHNPPTSRIMQAVRAIPHRDYTFNGTCDMAFATAPSIVLGPGRSERSHAADEFIRIPEIEDGIAGYTRLLHAYFTETQS